jgi:hypothetical protein
MQQRQLRLGDTLDDYCPRERRVTNHVVVAMIGDEVKQSRCTTCDSEHEFKHARVPRQRRKTDVIGIHPGAMMVRRVAAPPVAESHEHDESSEPDEVSTEDAGEVSAEVDESLFVAPSRAASRPSSAARPSSFDDLFEPALLASESLGASSLEPEALEAVSQAATSVDTEALETAAPETATGEDEGELPREEEGFVHRRLIRAQLPRIEGQPPAAPQRQTPDFTIRQPGGGAGGGRPNRFSNRQQRNAFYANRSSQGGGGNGNSGGNSNGNVMPRDPRGNQRPSNGGNGSGRPGGGSDRHGHRRKRSR